MFKNINKIRKDKGGFTLTEVMVGIMVLTVAIVSASNLLVGLISSNKNIVANLKAYYLAQEGIEAVGNLRDSNWLHNRNWRGDSEFLGELKEGQSYAVFLNQSGWRGSENSPLTGGSIRDLQNLAPFILKEVNPQVDRESARLCLQENSSGNFYSDCTSGFTKTDFYRYVTIGNYCPDPADAASCEDGMDVKSVVEWNAGGQTHNVTLEKFLTNWKGGAL